MDRASRHRRAKGTRRSRRTDTSSPGDRRVRRALPPTASRLRGARPPWPSSKLCRDAPQCQFPARTVRLSLARRRTVCGRGDGRRLHELEHETISLAAMLEDIPGAIVFRMAQRARRSRQFEAGLLDVLYEEVLVDSMQCRGLRIAGARLGAVIDDPVNPTGLERLEHGRIYVLAIDLESDHVVVVEMDDDGVKRIRRDRQQVGRVEGLADFNNVAKRGLLEPRVPGILDFFELLGERAVLRVNLAARSDDSRIQLGHVAAACES